MPSELRQAHLLRVWGQPGLHRETASRNKWGEIVPSKLLYESLGPPAGGSILEMLEVDPSQLKETGH